MLLGLDYIGRWSVMHAVVLLPGLRGLLPASTPARLGTSGLRLDAPRVLLIAAFVMYIVKAGGDNDYAFPFWRHFVHISPLVALLLGRGLISL